MKNEYTSLRLFYFLIPLNLSVFLVFSVFNVPFTLRLLTFISLFILITISNQSYKSYLVNFLNYHHILLFSLACLFSFLFFNDELKLYSPNILNVLALSFLSVLLVNYSDIYEKTIEYTVYLLTIILIISLPIHFFIYESYFLSATLFFHEFLSEDYATKNTLGVLLCLILPYVLFKLSNRPSLINIFIFAVFSLSIFYLFSRTALVLSAFILIAMLLTFKRNLVITSICIFFVLTLCIVSFQLTPEKYNNLKSLSNQQIKIVQNDELKSPSDVFSLSSYRSQYIIKSIEGFIEKPLFGHGFSKYQQNNKQFDKENRLVRKQITHNDYAQILYEQGTVGIVFLAYLFFVILFRLFVNLNNQNLMSIRIIQFLTLILSLNFINLLDHSLFWIFLSLNTVCLATKEPRKQ